jgi:hypothetical protein
MSETTLPPRRALYLLNPGPERDPEGIALVQAILDRKRRTTEGARS